MRNLAFAALLALPLAACTDGGDDCVAEEYRCSTDNVLEVCGESGWEVDEDCTESGMECHAEMGHCMEMDDSGMEM